ncbi:DUF4352 domain-containing protein [Enterococcus lactis]|uniref:DUF4352 domain-containing protein n=1 Tax=Enterococcus lactis TaxID=357441 RepID=UPI003D977765
MKKIILLILMASLFVITGCSVSKKDVSYSDNKKTENTRISKFKAPVVVDGLEISLTDFSEKTSINKEGNKQKLYIFDVTATNIGQDVKGLGAIDFVASTDKSKEYTVDIETPAFGGEVQPSETINGKAYFSVPINERVNALNYKPGEKVLNTWEVK